MIECYREESTWRLASITGVACVDSLPAATALSFPLAAAGCSAWLAFRGVGFLPRYRTWHSNEAAEHRRLSGRIEVFPGFDVGFKLIVVIKGSLHNMRANITASSSSNRIPLLRSSRRARLLSSRRTANFRSRRRFINSSKSCAERPVCFEVEQLRNKPNLRSQIMDGDPREIEAVGGTPQV
jgi:hypothetical protein